MVGTSDAYLYGNGTYPVNNQISTKWGFKMKRKSFIGVVTLGALLVIFAGNSQAGGVMHQSSGDERLTVESISQDFSLAEFGEGGAPREYWEALGTGSISISGMSSDLPDFDKDPRWKESGGE